VQITTREWNDPRLGLARPHALVTLDHVRASLPAWCRLETPIALQQRALGNRRDRLHRQILADWLAESGYPMTATLAEAIRLSLKTPETFFLPYPQRQAAVPFTCAWNGWLLGSPSDNPQDLIQHLWFDMPERLDPPRRQGRYPERASRIPPACGASGNSGAGSTGTTPPPVSASPAPSRTG